MCVNVSVPAGLRAGVMRGLQVHLESVMPGVRERGLAVGQCLMNSLHSMSKEKQLHFDLRESSDVDSILKLSRSASYTLCIHIRVCTHHSDR